MGEVFDFPVSDNQKLSSSKSSALRTTLGLVSSTILLPPVAKSSVKSSSSSPPPTPAVSKRSSTMRFDASRAVGKGISYFASPIWLRKVSHIPGVLSSRLCGMWNCIVLGGDWPNGSPPSSSSKSSSSSLSQMPAAAVPVERDAVPLAAFGFAGVRTLTPGVRGFRTGEEKISACN